MYFDPVAVPFAGEQSDVVFQLSADTVAAGVVVYGEVADAREVAVEGNLGDEMKGEKGYDLGIQFIDEQDLVGVV